MVFEKGNLLWKRKKKFKHSETTKISISNKKKGKYCGNGFKKGHISWNKGSKGIMKAWNKGKKCPEIYGMKGKHHSEETKIQISDKKSGKPSWNKGRNWSESERIKLSMAKTGEKEFTGFRQTIDKKIRLSGKYLQWRSEVFKRDNYHCQNCSNNDYIEAHHIISFSKLLEIYNIKTLEQAEKCEVLWNVGNGITYCRKCHMMLDENIGRRKKCAQILH